MTSWLLTMENTDLAHLTPPSSQTCSFLFLHLPNYCYITTFGEIRCVCVYACVWCLKKCCSQLEPNGGALITFLPHTSFAFPEVAGCVALFACLVSMLLTLRHPQHLHQQCSLLSVYLQTSGNQSISSWSYSCWSSVLPPGWVPSLLQSWRPEPSFTLLLCWLPWSWIPSLSSLG